MLTLDDKISQEMFSDVDFEDFIIRVGHKKLYGSSPELVMEDVVKTYENLFECVTSNSDRSVFVLYTDDKMYIIMENKDYSGWEYMLIHR